MLKRLLGGISKLEWFKGMAPMVSI